jgi:hypothetical protein
MKEQSHYTGCWRWDGHQECTITKVEELQAALEGLVGASTTVNQSMLETKRQREQFVRTLGHANDVLGRMR